VSAEPEFDPDRGVFRVRASALRSTAEGYAGLEPVAAAIADPLVRLSLEVLGGRPGVTCEGWVSPETAVMTVPLSDDPDPVSDVVVVPPALLAAAVAKLVALGPRPRPPVTGLLYLERAALGRLLEARDARAVVADDVDDDVVAALDELAEGLRLHWRVTATWTTPDGREPRRVVEAVDGGGAGIWLVAEIPEGGLALAPTTPTALWRQLATLLPSDEELAGTAPLLDLSV
jgi:hypothetical protein